MNAVLLLSLLGATEIFGIQLCFAQHSTARQGSLQIPNIFFDRDSLTLDPRKDESASHRSIARNGLLGRLGLLNLLLAATAAPATPQALPPSVSFSRDTAISAVAPVCLACTCNLGRNSCAALGGFAIYTGGEPGFGDETSVICSADDPCIVIPPETMSSCDPRCIKLSETCDPYNDLYADCKPIGGAQCGTDCRDRLPGDKVVCNPRDIASGVMKDVPKNICATSGSRTRRNARSVFSNRFAGFPLFSALLTSPADNSADSIAANTFTVPGSAVLPYVPTGNCIPAEIANAPYCTALD